VVEVAIPPGMIGNAVKALDITPEARVAIPPGMIGNGEKITNPRQERRLRSLQG